MWSQIFPSGVRHCGVLSVKSEECRQGPTVFSLSPDSPWNKDRVRFPGALISLGPLLSGSLSMRNGRTHGVHFRRLSARTHLVARCSNSAVLARMPQRVRHQFQRGYHRKFARSCGLDNAGFCKSQPRCTRFFEACERYVAVEGANHLVNTFFAVPMRLCLNDHWGAISGAKARRRCVRVHACTVRVGSSGEKASTNRSQNSASRDAQHARRNRAYNTRTQWQRP